MRAKTAVMIACGLMLLTGSAMAMTVDEIVAANIEAKGGEDAWHAMETAKRHEQARRLRRVGDVHRSGSAAWRTYWGAARSPPGPNLMGSLISRSS